MSVTKTAGRYPITALEVVTFLDGSQYLFWGGGPELFVNNLLNATSEPIAKFVLSGFDSFHGISPLQSIDAVAAFGGKSLLIISKTETGFETFASFQQLDDMILDFAVPTVQSATRLAGVDKFECMIGYAHNFVDVAVLHRDGGYGRHKRIHCPELSVLFNMKFFPGGNVIASGTVFGKIVVWQVDAATGQSALLCNVHEHEGVIFRIKLSPTGDRMITVSDDRTVRMWSIRYNEETKMPTELKAVYTGWGHISRVWDAVFLDGACGQHDGDIATCSEDANVKLWNAQGECTATLRGHGGDVWRLANALGGRVLVSGGNDAAVKVWDVSYQKQVAPDIADSTLVSVPIPAWKFPAVLENSSAVEEVSEEEAHAVDAEEDLDDLPVTKPSKKKPSASSRRANGVCSVRISPCLQYLVVVLVEGGVWLVRRLGEDSASHQWVQVSHLQAIVSTADVHFVYTDDASPVVRNVQVLIALLKGDDVHLSVDVSASASSASPPEVAVTTHSVWRAHEFRTVNIWFIVPSQELSTKSCILVATATIKGALTLWHLDSSAQDATPQPWVHCTTPGKEIVTACAYIRRAQLTYLVLGDARGSVSLFVLPAELLHVEEALAPVTTFMKLHGSDPVSCIEPHAAGFVTAGHDGMVNIYQEVFNSSDVSGLRWVHVSKRNCLPINTPDQIIVTTDSATSSVSGDLGLYVCGYHGSAFMIWDLRRGYQVMRVEGGGWKRPHRCMLSSHVQFPNAGTPLVRDLPSVLFVCPAPLLKDDTVLQLFGARPSTSVSSSESMVHTVPTLPQHLGCPAHGKVAYCNAFLSIPSSNQKNTSAHQFVVVGGEESCVKVFSVPELALCQEMSLSLNCSLKSLSSAQSKNYPERGIVLGGGGKLQYYIWTFDGSSSAQRRGDLGAVLHTAAEGTIWAKATQDHRILSVECAHLDTSVNAEGRSVEHYSILLCDSRGAATIGLFEHAYNLEASVGPRKAFVHFRVLQVLQPSQCPVLSSSLLHVTNNAEEETSAGGLVAIFGDTAGTVSVWALSRGSDASAVWQPAVKVEEYVAHTMGANAVSATILSTNSSGDDGVRAAQLLIGSGGDDQSICCASCTVQFDDKSDNTVPMEAIKFIDASGSAIKGLKLLPAASASASAAGVGADLSYHLASVGYDQRLSVWEVSVSPTTGRASSGSSGAADAAANVSASASANALRVAWKTGAAVSVSDVGALDVLAQQSVDGKESVVCCVAGEGLQLFTVVL